MHNNYDIEPTKNTINSNDIVWDAFKWVAQTRRGVRVFTPDPVPAEVIQNSIEIAHTAPSASNLQPWDFYWVRTDATKQEARRLCMGQPASESAQELVVCVANFGVWQQRRKFFLEYYAKAGLHLPKPFDTYYEKMVPLMYGIGPFGIIGLLKRALFAVIRLRQPMSTVPYTQRDLIASATKNTAFAAQNLMLAIRAQGFDSCALDGFDPFRMKRLLKLKRTQKAVLVIAIGKRAEADQAYGPKVRCDLQEVLHEV